jgi:hypothetical protein
MCDKSQISIKYGTKGDVHNFVQKTDDMTIFTQNRYLRKSGIYSWNIPAHFVRLPNGDKFHTCPNAGVCGGLCYAKTGAYQFSNVKKAHMDKLLWALESPDHWQMTLINELKKPKYKGKFIRIHDAGDFFNVDYAKRWMEIAEVSPNTTFYAYTKEVDMFKNQITDQPSNFTAIYSFGGRQDYMIDRENDRHSDVFPSMDELLENGYVCAQDDDRIACLSPNNKIGLVVNNIPHLKKKQGNRKFSDFAK